MLVGLIDVDSHNFPNLAVTKISAYHKNRGDHVEWWNGLKHYDVVYKSRVFDDTYTDDLDYCINADRVILGGTGYGLDNRLPDEIEHIYPDYSLYGINDTAYGFTTRGCPRNCGFCIVSEKEGGRSQRVADLYEFWQGQKYIKLLDPNLLACPDHEKILIQLIDSGAYVDFTQGLDIRLTNPDNIKLLNRVRTQRLHFAWDNPDIDMTENFRMFDRYTKIKDKSKRIVYVLTNYNSTHKQDLYRIYTLRDLGFDPYVMVYNKPMAPKITKRLQRWCNNRIIFGAVPKFEDYKH